MDENEKLREVSRKIVEKLAADRGLEVIRHIQRDIASGVVDGVSQVRKVETRSSKRYFFMGSAN